MNRPIYLDYAATTPVDPRVVGKMMPWLFDNFGNPASRSHAYGWAAEEAVELAREKVASLIGADPREVVWTSGATESNNLAIKGAMQFHAGRGKHVVTVKTEHKSVLDTVRELERSGCDVTVLDVQENGLLDLDAFRAALRPDTVIASGDTIWITTMVRACDALPHEGLGAWASGESLFVHKRTCPAPPGEPLAEQGEPVAYRFFLAPRTGIWYVNTRQPMGYSWEMP